MKKVRELAAHIIAEVELDRGQRPAREGPFGTSFVDALAVVIEVGPQAAAGGVDPGCTGASVRPPPNHHHLSQICIRWLLSGGAVRTSTTV